MCGLLESGAGLMIIKPIEPKSSGIGFQSKDNKDSKAKAMDRKAVAKAFVDMDDNQIRHLAYSSAYDKNRERHHNNSMLTAFYAMPVVASLSDGILTKGSLGLKAGVTAGTAAAWGFGLLMLAGYNHIKRAVVSDSPKLAKFEQNNPVASFLIDLGIFLGVAALGFRGAGKLGEKLVEKHPDLAVRIANKGQSMLTSLNKSNFNKKTLPAMNKSVDEFAEKAPALFGTGRFILANSVWILLLGSIIKGASHTNNTNDKIVEKYHELKHAQFDAAKYLAKEAEKEKEKAPKILIVEVAKPVKHTKHTQHTKEVQKAEIERAKKIEAEEIEDASIEDAEMSETAED